MAREDEIKENCPCGKFSMAVMPNRVTITAPTEEETICPLMKELLEGLGYSYTVAGVNTSKTTWNFTKE